MWWHHASNRPSKHDELNTELVKECEAFLSGHLPERWTRAHRPVPDWAWLSIIAHGSEAQLAFLEEDEVDGLVSMEQAWRYALKLVAGAVLAAAEMSGRTLEDIQREVLVPLELQLSTRSFVPDELVSFVVGALNDYRTS